MEIPPSVSADADTKISCLFERAYYNIFYHWYKDENLDNFSPPPTNDGPDNPGSYVLLKRRKRKDYRTSALPWPQKGPSVSIPVAGGTLPVYAPVNTVALFQKSGAGLSSNAIQLTSGTDTAIGLSGAPNPGPGDLLS